MRSVAPRDAPYWLGTLRQLGARSLAFYALHHVRLQVGWYRRVLPVGAWQPLPEPVLASARSIFPTHSRAWIQAHIHERSAAVDAARRIVDGELLYFCSQWLPRPAGWQRNPRTGTSIPAVHWTDLPPFGVEGRGDVKWIWEASRFDWVYQLGRGWAAAEDEAQAEEFAECFWQLLEDWRKHNPPNSGVNWRCGQECSFRLFALVWAAATFAEAEATTGKRLQGLWETVAALAGRVDRAMAHALSQNNNHGLSEAAALHLAGTCLPGHPLAGQWCQKGRRLFERQIGEQFKPDGSYSQNSTNYMRVALRDGLIFLGAVAFEGDEVAAVVLERLGAAAELLYQLQDPQSGRVPNYGANDGANVLQLSSGTYEDLRGVVQAATWRIDGARRYAEGPWDEELAWLGGEEALAAEMKVSRRRSFGREPGGYYGIRFENSFGFIRCHSHDCRPSHADMLHLDLWLRGRNVAADRGTYSYHDPEGWGSFLKGTHAHNTVTVDDRHQMQEGSRFLWLDWTRSRCNVFGRGRIDGWDGWLFDGEHYGYGNHEQGVVHRRQVLARDEDWLVVDDILMSEGPHQATLRWFLAGADDWTLCTPGLLRSETLDLHCQLLGPGSDQLFEEEGALPANGISRTYGEIQHGTLVARQHRAEQSFRWVTSFGQAPLEVEAGSLRWQGLSISLESGGSIQ